MGLKDFNYKQMAFDYGEKIGLAAAGAVALLLVVWLFIPGSGFFAPSAAANAGSLQTASEQVNKGLSGNTPTDEDSPPKNVEEKKVAFRFDFIPDSAIEKDYQVAGFFDGRGNGPGGRQAPSIKQPVDSDVGLVRFQLPGFVYLEMADGSTKIETLNITSPSGSGPGAPKTGGTTGSEGAGGNPNFPMGSGLGQPGCIGKSLQNWRGQQRTGHNLVKERAQGAEKGDHDYYVNFIAVDKLKGETLAIRPVPVRAGEIVASFPYLDQIKEFKDKLGLASDDDVLTELSQVEMDEQKNLLHSFRFLGVDVERRDVIAQDAQGNPLDAQGKPLGKEDGWAPVDLQSAYGDYVVDSGGEDGLLGESRFEKVAFTGLVPPRLPTLGAKRTPPLDEYPDLEDNLKTLKQTVDELNAKHEDKIAKPAFTQRPGNMFSLAPKSGGPSLSSLPGEGPGGDVPGPGNTGWPPMGPGGPGGTGSPAGPGGPGGTGGPGGPNGPFRPNGPKTPASGGTSTGAGFDSPTTGGPSNSGPSGVIPKYCLIRLFDYTIEPGKTYQYRLRVRMANPNYGLKNVDSQGIANDAKLPPDDSKDWYVLPKKLTVAPDVYFYAVDQAKLDAAGPPPKKDDDPKLPLQPVKKDSQTVLQIHKWVDKLSIKRVDTPVGDWAIAERVVASRGEPIGRQRVEAAYWRELQGKFTMAADASPKGNDKKYVATVEMPFAPDGEEPILVDFRGGDVTYARTHPKTDDAPPAAELPISDKAPEEVLLYTFDGKLLAHDAAKDATNPERTNRMKTVREWDAQVKKNAKEGGASGANGGLFNNGPGQ